MKAVMFTNLLRKEHNQEEFKKVLAEYSEKTRDKEVEIENKLAKWRKQRWNMLREHVASKYLTRTETSNLISETENSLLNQNTLAFNRSNSKQSADLDSSQVLSTNPNEEFEQVIQ